MSAAIKVFVDRLSNVLGPPKCSSLEAFRKELHIHLGKYSEDELQEAATLIFQTQKYRSWPLPGEMIVAAEEARRKVRVARVERVPLGKTRRLDSIGEPYTPMTKSEDDDYHSREAFAAADELIRSDLGRKAAHEGWIGDLYDFCRQYRRAPLNREQHRLIRRSRKTDELLGTERPGTRNHTLISSFVQRRSALSIVADGHGSGRHWHEQNEGKLSGAAE